METGVGFDMDTSLHLRLLMETEFKLHVQTGSQMLHELETGVEINVDASFCFRFHLEAAVHFSVEAGF